MERWILKTHVGDDDLDIAAIQVQRENEALEAELEAYKKQIENLRTHLSEESYRANKLNVRFRIIRHNFDTNMQTYKLLLRKIDCLMEDYKDRSLDYYCQLMELETRVLLWQAVSFTLGVVLLKKFLLK